MAGYRYYRWIFGPSFTYNLRIAYLQLFDGRGQSLVPEMTANNAPSPFVVTSNATPYQTLYWWKAFIPSLDENNGVFGATSAEAGWWLQIDCGYPRIISGMAWWSIDSNYYAEQTPRTVLFQGSNDGNNFEDLLNVEGLSWGRAEVKRWDIGLPAERSHKIPIPVLMSTLPASLTRGFK